MNINNFRPGLPAHALAGGEIASKRLLLVGLAALVILGLIMIAAQTKAKPTPCTTLDAERATIANLLEHGKQQAAVEQSEMALEQPNICPAQRKQVVRSWYETSLDLLLAGTPGDDLAAAGQSATRWQALERQAESLGLQRGERTSPLILARRAFDLQNWPLALATSNEAWMNNKGDVRLHYSILRTMGYVLAFRHGAEYRAQGELLLATAHQVALAYHLPQRAACQDLNALGYADCTSVAPDRTDPALSQVAMP